MNSDLEQRSRLIRDWKPTFEVHSGLFDDKMSHLLTHALGLMASMSNISRGLGLRHSDTKTAKS